MVDIWDRVVQGMDQEDMLRVRQGMEGSMDEKRVNLWHVLTGTNVYEWHQNLEVKKDNNRRQDWVHRTQAHAGHYEGAGQHRRLKI